MEVRNISPPVHGFLFVKLEQNIINHLWKIIDIAKNNNISFKNKLAGNISQSLLLEDLDSVFYNSVCAPLVQTYRENNFNKRDPVHQNALLGANTTLVLNEFWVNYQYKTEFNPYHDHAGVYSFAIWLKIPYDWEEQCKLTQFSEIDKGNIKAGQFQFEYTDSLGGISTYGFRLSPKLEGTMLFFPAKLRHCVYPFYEIDDPRISIAGNLTYQPN